MPRRSRTWWAAASAQAALVLSALAVLLGVQDSDLLPTAGGQGDLPPARMAAVAVGVLLLLSLPVVVAVVAGTARPLLAGAAGLLGATAAGAGLLLATDDVLVGAVAALGAATALALPPPGRPARLVAATLCALISAGLSAASLPDPSLLLVVPVVAGAGLATTIRRRRST